MNTGFNNQDIAIAGYSGHALVAAEAILLSGYKIVGYFDRVEVKNNVYKISYLGYEGNPDVLNSLIGLNIFPAVGDNSTRQSIIRLFEKHGFDIPKIIHPFANVSQSVSVGNGTLVCRGAMINPFAIIGKGSIVNTGAIVEHECIIGDYTHIAPGAVLAGNVRIGNGCFIGANSFIKQGVVIGDNTTIGAGAVVLNHVDNNTVLVGNPAKPLKP